MNRFKCSIDCELNEGERELLTNGALGKKFRTGAPSSYDEKTGVTYLCIDSNAKQSQVADALAAFFQDRISDGSSIVVKQLGAV